MKPHATFHVFLLLIIALPIVCVRSALSAQPEKVVDSIIREVTAAPGHRGAISGKDFFELLRENKYRRQPVSGYVIDGTELMAII